MTKPMTTFDLEKLGASFHGEHGDYLVATLNGQTFHSKIYSSTGSQTVRIWTEGQPPSYVQGSKP